ncbi:Fic family protein [Mucilaginibacter sp. X4EP1]|uniref:Fic family protein n=1 Tax=Mucilaginibacter sp. X4EP1 TaxID=2723092 RepID=UPI0021683E2A|nr:Fic family protein [Mucilaginibacter sp. X4EP1]MCS3812592.1 Fic family protein [Mucilaginibacter sp. X4EP1]
MNFKLETEFSKADVLTEVDALKKQIDDLRPLPTDVEGRVMQKLRLDWNYHSNAIEGNRLSYGETVAFLMEGITAKGKPLKDHLDIRGHNEAINFLLSIIKDTRPISEADIRNLHKMILVEPYDVKAQTADGLPTTKRITLGEYKTLPNHVRTATGETHYYATPEETPSKMQELMEWYVEISADKDVHPVVIAALFHHKFVSIHPFDDGNGRLSRILMNLILMQKGFPPVIIKMDDRKNYYALLSRADNGDNWPFIEYVIELLKNSLQLYVKAANGGDIDEDEDIDKEIALFKMELLNDTNVKVKRSNALINNVLTTQISPLINKLIIKAEQFNELFFENTHEVGLDFIISDVLTYRSLDHFINATTVANRDRLIDELERIAAVFTYEKFKNSENDFDIGVWVTVEFEEYFYKIVDFKGKDILSKLYHESLSINDITKIVKVFVESIKANINEKRKSPKS